MMLVANLQGQGSSYTTDLHMARIFQCRLQQMGEVGKGVWDSE